MNKLILALVVLISIPLYAQETAPLELNDADVESNPMETEFSDNAVHEDMMKADADSAPVADETPAIEIADEKPAPEPKEEFIAPAPPVKTGNARYAGPIAPIQRVEAELSDKKTFNPRASHIVTTFGFQNGKYEVIPKGFEFEGKKDFRNGQQEVWGGRVGVGGEIYLGAGFLTRSMVEGYYLGTLFSRILNGGSVASDVEFAYTKRTSQLMGFDASQSLGWMFDFKVKNPFMQTYSYMTMETYVEAGIGKAWAYNRINYAYDTGTAPTAAQEKYRLRVRDDLLNARIGAGFNITSSKGFFLSLKGTVNRYDVTQRKIDGYIQENGQAQTNYNEKQKDAKIDPVVIYTLGGGYKF